MWRTAFNLVIASLNLFYFDKISDYFHCQESLRDNRDIIAKYETVDSVTTGPENASQKCNEHEQTAPGCSNHPRQTLELEFSERKSSVNKSAEF